MLANALRLPAPSTEIAGSAPRDTSGQTFVGDNLRLLRRHKRELVNVRAVVYSGIASQPATIYDISDGGVGLDGAGALFPGSEVKIALMSGETRSGIVRWWLAGRCGVEFDALLGQGDVFRSAALKRSKPRDATLARSV